MEEKIIGTLIMLFIAIVTTIIEIKYNIVGSDDDSSSGFFDSDSSDDGDSSGDDD